MIKSDRRLKSDKETKQCNCVKAPFLDELVSWHNRLLPWGFGPSGGISSMCLFYLPIYNRVCLNNISAPHRLHDFPDLDLKAQPGDRSVPSGDLRAFRAV